MRAPLVAEDIFFWRELTLDPSTREVRRTGVAIKLTRREYEILFVLMREPRRLYKKEELLELVWGHDFDGSSTALATYISYLRQKLDLTGQPSYIRTVRGAGYGMAR